MTRARGWGLRRRIRAKEGVKEDLMGHVVIQKVVEAEPVKAGARRRIPEMRHAIRKVSWRMDRRWRNCGPGDKRFSSGRQNDLLT